MFNKQRTPSSPPPVRHTGEKGRVPSVIAADFHLLGNVVSDGMIDFDGKIEGNIKCNTITVRHNAVIKGDIFAQSVLVYGRVNGVIRARSVQLFASAHVEGIIMHEHLAIEDGAFVDGKFKRADKIDEEDDMNSDPFAHHAPEALYHHPSSGQQESISSPTLEHLKIISG